MVPCVICGRQSARPYCSDTCRRMGAHFSAVEASPVAAAVAAGGQHRSLGWEATHQRSGAPESEAERIAEALDRVCEALDRTNAALEAMVRHWESEQAKTR